MKWIMVLLILMCICVVVMGSIAIQEAHRLDVSILATEELMSPYNKAVQLDTFLKVLTIKGYRYDVSILMPTIKNANKVSDKEYHKAIGFDCKGSRCPLYDPDTNTIYLIKGSKIHTLAHEYTHYVQVKYQKVDPKRDAMDFLEMDAISVQNYFR